jgi:protein-S-isoprenylcysteine O-methyltransferase Ste14
MKISPRLALFTTITTFAYLALAICGEGGIHAYFSHPPLIALAIVLCALSASSLFTAGNLSSGEREDRGNRWVLIVFGIVGTLSGWLPAYTDRINLLTFGGDAVRWLGIILFAAGGALRIWPVFVLGRRFSGLVAIQPDHTLVTTGIYRFIRNPSYLGLLISSIGWALAFRSSLGVLLALCYIPPLIARMHAEERLLQSQFGEAYAAYRNRSWRLIPGVY